MSSPLKRKIKKKLSKIEKTNLLCEYKEGKISQNELAEKYNCSKSSVQRIVKNMVPDDQRLMSSRKYFEYEILMYSSVHQLTNRPLILT